MTEQEAREITKTLAWLMSAWMVIVITIVFIWWLR